MDANELWSARAYADPLDLLRVGPTVMGAWSRMDDGVPPVEGVFIIDTGADQTVLSASVAAELGLSIEGTREADTAGGLHLLDAVPQYLGSARPDHLTPGGHVTIERLIDAGRDRRRSHRC